MLEYELIYFYGLIKKIALLMHDSKVWEQYSVREGGHSEGAGYHNLLYIL